MPPIGAATLPHVAAYPSLTLTVPAWMRGPRWLRPRRTSRVHTEALRPYSVSFASLHRLVVGRRRGRATPAARTSPRRGRPSPRSPPRGPSARRRAGRCRAARGHRSAPVRTLGDGVVDVRDDALVLLLLADQAAHVGAPVQGRWTAASPDTRLDEPARRTRRRRRVWTTSRSALMHSCPAEEKQARISARRPRRRRLASCGDVHRVLAAELEARPDEAAGRRLGDAAGPWRSTP